MAQKLPNPGRLGFVATVLVLACLGFVGRRILVDNSVAQAPIWFQSMTLYGDNVVEQRLCPSGAPPSPLHLFGSAGPMGRSTVLYV